MKPKLFNALYEEGAVGVPPTKLPEDDTVHDFKSLAGVNDFEVDKGQTQVLLMTSFRSGSTFMGQIFNQHPDVFYRCVYIINHMIL